MKTYLNYLIISLFLLFLNSCDKENSVQPNIKLVKVTGETYGGFSLTGKNFLLATNPYGGIILDGSWEKDTVKTYLYKTIKAESKAVGLARLEDIKVTSETVIDTITTKIKGPQFTDEFSFVCSFSLSVPYDLPCKISYAEGGVATSDLDQSLMVLGSNSNSEVIRHSGSCKIITTQGNIKAEVALPDSGFCHLITGLGDITLSIPDTTSCTIQAIFQNGEFAYQGFEFAEESKTATEFTATIGTGLNPIFLESKKGNITIIGF